MSDRTSYWVPVGWHSPYERGGAPWPITEIHSHAEVLLPPQISGGADFAITRIHGAWSRHIPEKRPRYRMDLGRHHVELSPVRLATVPIGNWFIAPMRANRTQVCFRRNGHLHGVAHNRDVRAPVTFCGLEDYISSPSVSRGDDFEEHFIRGEVPTCPACLVQPVQWCLYIVWPHTKKPEAIKRTAKAKSAEDRRLKLPTAYDRILDDELFERPTYKPVKAPAAPPEPVDIEEEYDDDPRDSKRASAIDRQRRLEESKARVQGHRR